MKFIKELITVKSVILLVTWSLLMLFLFGFFNLNSTIDPFRIAYRKINPIFKEMFPVDLPPKVISNVPGMYLSPQQLEDWQETGTRHFRDRFHEKNFTETLKGWDNTRHNSSYLIYRCDTTTMSGCGGWADRVKGMLSGFVLANLTGRTFKIEMILPPCDLQKLIVPHQVNWSLPTSIHKNVTAQNESIQVFDYLNSVDYYDQVKTINFHKHSMRRAKYVYYKANLDYMDSFRDSRYHQVELSWMKNKTRDQINAALFKHLFKLTPLLENKIQNFLSTNLKPTDKLICAHVRTGTNPTIPNDTESRIKVEDFHKIWQFLYNISHGNDSKIFLMTDSEEVKAQSRKQVFRDKFIYNGGHIFHIEKSTAATASEKCDGLETVIFEQFVLMRCDVLMVSKSGLGRMAAYVRGSNRGLFCLLSGANIVPCRMSDMTKLYNIYG